MDKILSGIVKEIAEKYSIPESEVEFILNSPYKMMRETIQNLELHGKNTEDLKDVKSNFAMPGLFKLYLNTNKLYHINKRKINEGE